jgi:hypothetical protein
LRDVSDGIFADHNLLHDRDRIFAAHLDNSIAALGFTVLRAPIASPKANAIWRMSRP